MTQEELAQLQSLLHKAKRALPKADRWTVGVGEGGLVLIGQTFNGVCGEVDNYYLLPTGEVKVETNLVY